MPVPELALIEEVILCDPSGAAIGVQPKATVHHADTPLHLAFSCYVFDRSGNLLVTRRAHGKRTWPSIRTNSCCGHPLPGESMAAAIGRRLQTELGILAATLELLLPAFSYRATMADGTVENELCPVYRAVVDDRTVTPEPAEVAEAWWQPWSQFLTVDEPADPRSPWSTDQLAALSELGPDPLQWPAADPARLPAAATP